MDKILVSACMLGTACRYDGRSVPKDEVISLGEKYILIPFCPEIYGGLPTPRVPSEFINDRVVMKNGNDVTENYLKGANEALRICNQLGIKIAVLKEKSPSCGKGKIYDGTFSGTLTDGDGMTVRVLQENGIKVFGESEISSLLD